MKLTIEDVDWLLKELRGLDFFAYYSAEEIEQIIDRMEKKAYPAGRTIIRQGDKGKFFFLIKSGNVAVIRKDADGTNRQLATLGPREYFGEISLLTGAPRNATIKSLTQTEVFLLYPDDFKDILRRNPRIAKNISNVVAKRQKNFPPDLAYSAVKKVDLLFRIRKFFRLK